MTKNKTLEVPKLHPVPMVPMSDEQKRAIVKDLKSIAKELWRGEVQDYALQCYARIWVHCCHSHPCKPPHASNKRQALYTYILHRWLAAASSAGLHTPQQLDGYWASRVAALARELWEAAVAEGQPKQERLAIDTERSMSSYRRWTGAAVANV